MGVRTVGAVLTGEAFKLQWQGFALIAPVAQVTSPKGNLIEGIGVQPDTQIAECKSSNPPNDRLHQRCLEQAIAIVSNRL